MWRKKQIIAQASLVDYLNFMVYRAAARRKFSSKVLKKATSSLSCLQLLRKKLSMMNIRMDLNELQINREIN